MYGNGRPLGMRKRMQLLVAVVLLAWATQTLLHQWGFGAELPRDPGVSEKFVPGSARFAAGATLEVRGDATVVGADVKLRQMCRWADSDAQVFLPVADLVMVRIEHGSPFRTVTLDQIRRTLHDAGMNLGVVRFAGPMSCTVTRSDASFDEQTALRQWAEAKEGKEPEADPHKSIEGPSANSAQGGPASQTSTSSPAPAVPASASSEAEPPARTLRSLLLNDLSVRLGLEKEKLEVTFNPADEKLLNLSEPLFKFNIEPRSVHDLGEVSWNVLILTGSGSQKGTVTATARSWQQQVVLNRPLTFQQVIQDEDVAERRILSDRLPGETLLNLRQIVGQQASRDLNVGTVLSSRMVNGVPLVKPGQLVTVTLTVGSVRIKTVGRALGEGAYGQTVKVRNETTLDVLEVVMVGPQQGTMDPLPSPARATLADTRN